MEDISTEPLGKMSLSVTIMSLHWPISFRPDQPAIAAPDEKIRIDPAKKGRAKLSSAVKGTAEAMNTEKTKIVSEKDFLTAVMSRVKNRHAARINGVNLIYMSSSRGVSSVRLTNPSNGRRDLRTVLLPFLPGSAVAA